MNIKEVAKMTNLTTKTLRYYESLGLISVQRQLNGYRVYDETTIKRLQFIRLLRFCDFSLDEIEQILCHPDRWSNAIENRIKQKEQRKQHEEHVEVLFDLLKNESLDYVLENADQLLTPFSDERFLLELNHLKSPSVFSTMVGSFILSGPILWGLFMTFDPDLQAKTDFRLLIPLLMLSSVVITILWKNTIDNLSKDRKRANAFISFLLLIVAIVLGIGSIALANVLQSKLFHTDTTIILAPNYHILSISFLVVTMIVIMSLIFGWRYQKTQDLDFEHFSWLLNKFKKYWHYLLISYLGFCYIFISNVTLVHMDGSLTRFSPFNLKGTDYAVLEFSELQVGYNHGLFKQYQHDFSMVIVTDDFKVDLVSGTNFQHEAFLDTYDVLEYLDKIYMQQNIKKSVLNTDSKNCTYDQKYCDLFDSILTRIND